MKGVLKNIIKAIDDDDVETLRFLFSKNKTLGNLRVNIDDDTPLMYSLRKRSGDCSSFLLANSDLSLENNLNESYKDLCVDSQYEKENIKRTLSVDKEKNLISPLLKNKNKNKNKKDPFKI